MTAETGVIVVEFEYDRQQSEGEQRRRKITHLTQVKTM